VYQSERGTIRTTGYWERVTGFTFEAMSIQMQTADATLVRFTSAAFRQLRDHVQRAPGVENCGALVRGADDTVERIVPMPNQAPDRRSAYAISPRLLFEIERAAKVAGFYHSHPDGTSTPSAHDLEAAWPGYIYVIAGHAVRAWRLNPVDGGFEELAVVVES